MFANYTHYGKSSESLEGDHWADRCRDRGATVPPFNVTSHQKLQNFFQNSLQVKYYSRYCQLSYVITGKLLATLFLFSFPFTKIWN